MAKLTDESVAKALGWKRRVVKYPKLKMTIAYWEHAATKRSRRENGNLQDGDGLPPWTTSLDAIVAEIEARDLRWSVLLDVKTPYFSAFVENKVSDKRRENGRVDRCFYIGTKHRIKTAPLALCAALLAYLKEHP